ncbi:hypothetical protein LQF61_12295 [Tetragenococcus koreensis]|uniref:Uncharacterized protein n=1 Tax=Tetragenococcus koreensis TaxID=290335 RepID=A0AAN4ZPL1_9ENTE|nr:hypothetical protein [Tetragenococcus koreensis]AYW46450.1 hypothetical protein C7K43_11250 [Tetragenococcus koreensis]MCF1585064.1 hypothetical protein [Tetragenococcus koreensis]MCF1617075.1 hypothetical protein [Tetragenococcus koreensis]MCF1620826.1 hypothetical protein [Tetragenococcus koreensis]MCF1621993.1 hypothetical protein [Tetragenococcus koreensis]
MEEDIQWSLEQLDQLVAGSLDYKQKALLLGMRDLLLEQQKRTEQIQGQLDGTLWSPNDWGE